MTSLEMVLSVDEERLRLEKEAEHLAELEMTPDVEARMHDVYERCGVVDGGSNWASPPDMGGRVFCGLQGSTRILVQSTGGA